MKGISGHADQKILLQWLKNIKTPPKTVFVNHGEEASAEEFANVIFDEIGTQAVVPYNGGTYDLLTDKCLAKGNTIKIEKKTYTKPSSAYERLLLAGKRLMSIIEKNKQGANKDLAKLTDKINELCNKWDR